MWVLLLLLHCAAAGPAAVTLNRCCGPGEAYSWPVGGCARAPVPAQPQITPPIYSLAAQTLLPEMPAEWQVLEEATPRCDVPLTVLDAHANSPPQALLFDNGSLWMLETQDVLNPDAFCVDADVVLVCEGGVFEVRFRKCCLDEGVYSEAAGGCSENSKVGPEAARQVRDAVGHSVAGARLTAGFPSCTPAGERYEVAGSIRGGDGALKPDGSLLLRGDVVTLTLRAGEFCLERVVEHKADQGVQVLACPEAVSATRSRVLSHMHADEDVRFSLYPAGLCLSALFLAATLCAGSLMPAASHALHWRCQTAHVACLLAGDVLLAATQMAGASLRGPACSTIAILMHFFFLAAFFWLNTMCINIWWTFRDLRPTNMDKRQETMRLRLFQIYAWGSPVLISSVAAIVDSLPDDVAVLRPRFGHSRCWFYGDTEIFYYFYGPVGILLLINLMLFGATAHELTCGLWKREVVKSTTERATLWRVCLKLVVVMGLTWVVDVISWAVGGPAYLWYATDLVNALQGVLIFGVVGCQPQVWSAINRMWCLRERRDRAIAGHRHLSCYSQGLPSLGDSTINAPSTKNTSPVETVC